ncbi:Gfo/Idh/MocA family protein [Arthrobacter psychrolactophilus]
MVRFFPEYVELKKLLSSGAVPAVLELSRSSAAPAAGSWFFDEAMGGGIVPDQMIHDIDQALWLAGEVREVTAVQNPPSSGGVVPRPVTARIELLHSNGVRSYLNGNWGADDVPFSTSIKVAAADGAVVYAWPQEAAASADGTGGPAPENTPGDYLPVQSPQDSPYTLQIADFVAARDSGAPARVTPADGVMAVALAEAAIVSIKTGKTIHFPAAKVLALLGGEGPPSNFRSE